MRYGAFAVCVELGQVNSDNHIMYFLDLGLPDYM